MLRQMFLMVSARATLFRLLPSKAASGTSEITREMYGSVLQAYLKNLWDFMRDHNERGISLPLPSYVCVAFTNPAMAHPKPRHSDLTSRVMIHCIRALVVNKLAAVVNSRTDPIGDDELACIATVLDLESSDVELCLRQPGTIELVVMTSLAFGYLDSEGAIDVPLDAHDVLQHTLNIVSQSLPAQENVEQQLDYSQTAALAGISGGKFERVIVLCFHNLLETCRLGNSSLTEEVRTSCLRICLKSVWHISKVCCRVFDKLPHYFPVLLASPEITEHLQSEPDSAARIIGHCFGALIADKVLDDLLAQSRVPSTDSFYDTQLACISAILGTDPRHGQSGYDQLRILNLRSFVSVMAENLASLFDSAMPVDVLMIASHTLHDLTISLHNNVYVTSIDWPERSVSGMNSDPFIRVMNRGDPLNHEMVKTFLRRLRRLLNKALLADPELPGVLPFPRRDSDPPSPPRPQYPPVPSPPQWQPAVPGVVPLPPRSRSPTPTLRTRPHSPASIQSSRPYSPVPIQPPWTYSPVPMPPPRVYSSVPNSPPTPYIPPQVPYIPSQVPYIPPQGPYIPPYMPPRPYSPASTMSYSPVLIPYPRLFTPGIIPPVPYPPGVIPPVVPYSSVRRSPPIVPYSFVPPPMPYAPGPPPIPYLPDPPPIPYHRPRPVPYSPAYSPAPSLRSYSPMTVAPPIAY